MKKKNGSTPLILFMKFGMKNNIPNRLNQL